MTTAQVCEVFRVTDRMITKWLDAGCPVQHQGGQGRGDESLFDVGDVHRWLLHRDLARVRRETPDGELKAITAERARKDLAVELGELVSADDVEGLWNEGITSARMELLALADRLKEKVDATYGLNTDPALFEGEVMIALAKIVGHAETIAADDEPEEDEAVDDAEGGAGG